MPASGGIGASMKGALGKLGFGKTAAPDVSAQAPAMPDPSAQANVSAPEVPATGGFGASMKGAFGKLGFGKTAAPDVSAQAPDASAAGAAGGFGGGLGGALKGAAVDGISGAASDQVTAFGLRTSSRLRLDCSTRASWKVHAPRVPRYLRPVCQLRRSLSLSVLVCFGGGPAVGQMGNARPFQPSSR